VKRSARAQLMTLIAAVALSATEHVGIAAEPDARAIMEANFFVSKFTSLTADSYMALINAKGQKRERSSTNQIKLQANGIDSSFLVRFSSPTDIRGTSFLQIEHSDGDDDLWIYLPALKKSRRLVASNKKDSFVGSDFSYGDILIPKVHLYGHTLLRSENIEGHDCYVIESVPATETVESDSGYSKKITWVRKDNFLETKVDYFDVSGRLLKTQSITEHEQVQAEPERWIAMRREMVNHQTGHRTEFRFARIEPEVELSDELFTTRYLERE
jgi:hypothetical protein